MLKQSLMSSFRILAGSVGLAVLTVVDLSAATLYVNPGNPDEAEPYDTPATGCALVSTAIDKAADGDLILLCTGVHEVSASLSCAKAITMRGLGAAPGDVILRNMQSPSSDYSYVRRVLTVNNANARIENLTLENGCVKNKDGGNLNLAAGIVSNCVIRGGQALAADGWACGAGVVLSGAGILTHCVISNNVITGTSGDDYYAAGALAVGNGAKKGRISNCLIAFNRYLPSVNGKTGSAGVRFVGSNDETAIENCTIVSNVVEGTLSSGSAGLYCRTWYGRLRNNIVIGNYETGLGKFTSVNVDTAHCTYVNHLTDADATPEQVFRDFAGGDFTLGLESPARDAGTTSLALLPGVDLAGNPRVFDLEGKKRIDIGCYECQSALAVSIESVSYDRPFESAVATFTHKLTGSSSPATATFTYDFGDGSEPMTTSAATISHTYAGIGAYTVKITADNTAVAGERISKTYADYVRVCSPVVYVNPDNASAAFPYATPATGYGKLKTAVGDSPAGTVILLCKGVHKTSDQVAIGKSLVVRGLGETPEDVIVRNTSLTPDSYYYRVLEVNNANAHVSNLTLENGCVKNQNGGNLRLVVGVVSNCVIRGGRAVASSGNAAGSAVELAGAAVLTHCVITNNATEGASSNGDLAGGAVFFPWNGGKNGRVSNCLIAGNRYLLPTGQKKTGAAGIAFGGGNENMTIENCTIAGNVVEGSLNDDSAGMRCTSWSCTFRNDIIVGNYETEKGKYTSAKIDSHSSFTYGLTDAQATPAQVFADFAHGDYTLRLGCPACNKGTTALTLKPSVDLLGNPRVFDSHGRNRIDMGCYECQSVPGMILLMK